MMVAVYLVYEIPILTDYRFNVNDVYSEEGEIQPFPLNQTPRELFSYQPGFKWQMRK